MDFNRSSAEGPDTSPPSQQTGRERPRDREGRFLRTDREPNGTFKAGVPGPALKTGRYSALVANGTLDGRVDELAQMRSDLERGDLNIVRSSLARRFTALDAMAQNLEDQIQSMGLVSAKGRKRSIGQAYFDAARLLLGYADRLGIAPPPKGDARNPVNLSPEEFAAHLEAMAVRARALAARTAPPAAPTEKPAPFSMTVEE